MEHYHSAGLGIDKISCNRIFVVFTVYYVTVCLQADSVIFIDIVKFWKESNEEFSR